MYGLGELGEFLRSRRGRLAPGDMELPEGTTRRRRVPGLRRDEVARLAEISVDYYIELEQGRGGRPSAQIVDRLATALLLDPGERAYALQLAGYHIPPAAGGATVLPGLLALLDTPAMITTDLHETVAQNPQAAALLGVRGGGSFIERWFTAPSVRRIYPSDDHDLHSQALAADLRVAAARRRGDPAAEGIVARLLAASAEFRTLWAAYVVSVPRQETSRIMHPEFGLVEVRFNVLHPAGSDRRLQWWTIVDQDVARGIGGLASVERGRRALVAHRVRTS